MYTPRMDAMFSLTQSEDNRLFLLDKHSGEAQVLRNGSVSGASECKLQAELTLDHCPGALCGLGFIANRPPLSMIYRR